MVKQSNRVRKTAASGVRKETTRQRPETTSREGKIAMLVGAGLGNAAVWSAMEAENPSIIKDAARRHEVSGDKHLAYDADLRGKISRAINSVRGLAIKEDQRVMGLVEVTGGGGVITAKSLDDMEMRNRHRFSWGIDALDDTYGVTRFVHLEDHPDSKYRDETKKIKTRDDKGGYIFTEKKVRTWLGGTWRAGDPMIPDGDGFLRTREADGTKRKDLDVTKQIVEIGCPEGFISIWGGAPGAGKSKLAVKSSKSVIKVTEESVLYVNGEAEEEDFRGWVGHDTDPDLFRVITQKLLPVDAVVQTAHQLKPRLIVIDSVQTLAEWNKGNRGQQAVMHILSALKSDPKAGRPHIILISQLNKAGDLKGSRDLEHLADAVAAVTQTERDHVSQFEIPIKNRGGPTPAGFMFKHLADDVLPFKEKSTPRVPLELKVPDNTPLGTDFVDPPLSSDQPDDGEDDGGDDGEE